MTRQGSPSAADRWLEFVDPAHRHEHIYEGCLWRWRDDRWVNVTLLREAAASEDSSKAVAQLIEDGARERRMYELTPSWDDLKAELPGLNVIEHEDGSKSADFSDRSLDLRNKKRLNEMLGDRREVEIEKSEVISARVETVAVGKGSRRRVVPVQSAEKVDRALHEAG